MQENENSTDKLTEKQRHCYKATICSKNINPQLLLREIPFAGASAIGETIHACPVIRI